MPGLVVHGSGQWALGRTQTASRVLLLEGAGTVLLLSGGIPLIMTGASRYVVGPTAVLTIGGVSLFGISWLADLYAVWSPDGGVGRPETSLPRLTSEFGYRYVYDPQFSYRHFSVLGFELWLERLRLAPAGYFGLDEVNSRLELRGAYRVWDGRHSPLGVASGSFVEIGLGIIHHDFGQEGFRSLTGEGSVSARLDLVALDEHLSGSFVQALVGYGHQAFDLDVQGGGFGSDGAGLLLSRFAFGFYLGGFSGKDSGEVSLYYDHRHDDFAAGLKLGGLGSGVAGHFGATGRYFWNQHWGAQLDAQAGSAYVSTVSLLYRYGRRALGAVP